MKTVQISEGEVKIKELTFGDENNASRKAIERALLEGKQNIDIITKREFLLLESIVECPFPKNLESLRALSRQDGMKITTAFNELNEVVQGESTLSEQKPSKESTQTESLESTPEK